jgi:hypothetical protein
MEIVKRIPNIDLHEVYIAAMWLMFLRAPGRETAPGKPVDLGETRCGKRIGRV